MKKIIVFILICTIIVSLGSCKKYLDAKPSMDLAIPSGLPDLQALLDNNGRMNLNYPLLAQVSTDEYYLNQSDWDRLDVISRMAYIWDTAIYAGSNTNDWGYAYLPVYYANEVLEKISMITRTASNQQGFDNVKGSALFYRANCFLQALFIWAKAYEKNTAINEPGIPLRLTADFNAPSQRASIEESYQQVLSDLKTASQLLPAHAVHVMRPSKQAAYGLLARTYLSMREYDSCGKYASLCLQQGGQLMDYNTLNASLAYPVSRFNTEVLLHNRCFFTYNSPLYVYARIDSLLYNSYAPNDLRKTIFYKSNGDGSYFFRGSYDNTFYFFNGIALNEIYLMHAECLARTGDAGGAMQVLNDLLKKRWVTGQFVSFTTTDAADALHKVLTERKKELVFMNLRWMDIKRLNTEGRAIVLKRKLSNVIYELMPNENRYALPIPPDIISLTGMQQNPR